LKIAIIILVFLFGLFQSDCSNAQELSLRFDLYSSIQAGSAVVRWRSDLPIGSFSTNKRWSESTQLLGCLFMSVLNNTHELGVMYEFQKSALTDYGDEFARRVLEHHLLAFYGHEVHTTSHRRMPTIVRLCAGFSNLRAKDNSAYLLRYSSPNIFNSYWNGFLCGMDGGLGFMLGQSPYALEIVLSARFGQLGLSRALRAADKAELNAQGEIKNRLVGICLGFSKQRFLINRLPVE
jgi:hypothetical protein